MSTVTLSKKDMKKRKLQLAHDIRNLREDYAGVDKEDMPDEINVEIATMMVELKELRVLLGND